MKGVQRCAAALVPTGASSCAWCFVAIQHVEVAKESKVMLYSAATLAICLPHRECLTGALTNESPHRVRLPLHGSHDDAVVAASASSFPHLVHALCLHASREVRLRNVSVVETLRADLQGSPQCLRSLKDEARSYLRGWHDQHPKLTFDG